MKRLLTGLFLAASLNASAIDWCGDTEEQYLRLGLWSKHHGKHSKKDNNETHNQLGYEYGQCLVAYYNNSNYEDTIIAGRKFSWKLHKRVDAGVMLGVVYSEDYLGKEGLQLAPPVVFMEVDITDKFSVEFTTLPTVVTAVGFRWRF